MNEETLRVINCAKCPGPVCNSSAFTKGPENCPTRIEADVVAKTKSWYKEAEVAEFARRASIVEGEAFMKTPLRYTTGDYWLKTSLAQGFS